MLLYGLFGLFSSFICAIISTYASCATENSSEYIKNLCIFSDDNEVYYYDSYILYFKELSSKYLTERIFIIIIRIIDINRFKLN